MQSLTWIKLPVHYHLIIHTILHSHRRKPISLTFCVIMVISALIPCQSIAILFETAVPKPSSFIHKKHSTLLRGYVPKLPCLPRRLLKVSAVSNCFSPLSIPKQADNSWCHQTYQALSLPVLPAPCRHSGKHLSSFHQVDVPGRGS